MKLESKKPTLHELQSWMRWVITDPRGVKEALKDPHPKDSSLGERFQSPDVSALEFILEMSPASREDRLDIYAEGYFSRIAESMAQDFPAVFKILGKDLFLKLIADYLKKYPSRSFNLGEIGRNLSWFSRDHIFSTDFAYLPDLAELEWLLVRSFYAADRAPYDPVKLSTFTESQWATVQIDLDPSVFILHSDWPVDEIWHRRKDPDIYLECAKLNKGIVLLIYRNDGLTRVERIGRDEVACLDALINGQTLSSALNEFDEPSSAQSWLARLMGNGLLKDFRL